MGGSTGPGFVSLIAARQLPVGSQVDARAGTIQLVSASARAGKTQTGAFGGAVFGIAQSTKGPQKGLTILSLLEGAFPGAPSYAKCRARPADDRTLGTAAALSGRVLQLLRCHGERSVSHPRALQRRDRARYPLGHGRPMRRHPDPGAPRHRGRKRLRAPQDDRGARRPQLSGQSASTLTDSSPVLVFLGTRRTTASDRYRAAHPVCRRGPRHPALA